MKLQDILTKYNYHNTIQEDNTIVSRMIIKQQ